MSSSYYINEAKFNIKKEINKSEKSMKYKILDVFNSSKSQSECMQKLKAMDKKGGTKWGDPGYMQADVFNGLISLCLGAAPFTLAMGTSSFGLFGVPVGLLGLYLTGVIFHLRATKYDKFHLLEHYDKKIKRQKKVLEAAIKKEKDPEVKKELDKRIKEADKAIKAIDKERRKLLPEKVRKQASSYDDLDDFDFDFDDDDWLNFDDEETLDESYVVEGAHRSELKPVFLVTSYKGNIFNKITRAYTKSKYTHAAISFDPSLEYMYSYSVDNKYNKHGGLSFESISDDLKVSPDHDIRVACIFLNEKDYANLNWKLSEHINHLDSSKYNYGDIFNIVMNRPDNTAYEYSMICSQFVDSLLKFINIDITGMPSNLVTPGVVSKVKNPKVYLLYEGKAAKYNPAKIEDKIDRLLSTGTVAMRESTIIKHDVQPIFEAKEFPVGFDEEGNLLIKRKRNIDYATEHAKSKKLYKTYDKNCNYEAMAYEADKLWYMNLLILKDIEQCKDEKKKEELISMRSKILNEFTLYINAITKHEGNKDYNFEIHFENSPFSDASVKITGSTLKYILKGVRGILTGII